MTDFIQAQGLIFLPHILRRLANRFSDACDEVFADFGLVVPTNLVSTTHLLWTQGPAAVTDIATAIGQSHPFVIKGLKELKSLGLVSTRSDPKDGRRTIVALTAKGKLQAQRLLDARPAFEAAYRRLMSEAGAEIFEPLWRMEDALRTTAFAERITIERERLAQD